MIHLIALCKVPTLKKFGINKILKPFMEDVKKMEAVGLWGIFISNDVTVIANSWFNNLIFKIFLSSIR